MTDWLSDEERRRLYGAERIGGPSPIPTREVSNGEFFPRRQTAQQQQVEQRIRALAEASSKRHGLTQRQFLQTACGMAAAFVAMNEVYGPFFLVEPAEAVDLAAAAVRAKALSGQFIFDDHIHFLREDTRLTQFISLRESASRSGKAPELAKASQTLEHLKFENYVKEIWLDSDITVAILSGAPSDIPGDWFLTNEMKA